MQRTIDGMTVPHKTGATDSVRTECALFRLQSRVVACGFTKQNTDIRWVVDNEAQVSLGKIGAAVVAAWPRALTPTVVAPPHHLHAVPRLAPSRIVAPAPCTALCRFSD